MMITQKPGATYSWEHFMQLKTQARMRNAGLGGARNSAPISAQSPVLKNVRQSGSTGKKTDTMIQQSGYYQTKSIIETKRILGGTFDAWA